MTDQEIIDFALYIASIRHKKPELAQELEQILYSAIADNYPESTIYYILQLTELQVYQ